MKQSMLLTCYNMIVAFYLMFLPYVAGQCQITLPPTHLENEQLIQCVTGILNKYFTEQKEITYFNIETEDQELLKTINLKLNLSLVTRKSTYQSILTNQGYLVNSNNVTKFTQYFEYLMTDPTWNPYARFLILIHSLQQNELRLIFDELLRLHVNNALVVNGTAEAHLFTYNPFDKYACGKYYNDIISLGLCSQATDNLYPNKLVTGLKNCTFNASLAHRPPFAIDPLQHDGKKTLLGTEEYIFKILSEKEQFNVILNYNFDTNAYSWVAPNMTVSGSLIKLRNNETDVVFGGMMMVTTRAQALTWLTGYHDYNDDIRFAVKRAIRVPIWKTIYMAFDFTVWMLLLLSFIVYFAMMIFLLQAKDKGLVALELLENLLLHGRDIRCPMTIKCVLMVWVWFAYLVNTFYTSSLVSLTTNPSKEYQIQTEDELEEYGYKPCFSAALRLFLKTEPADDTSKKFKMPLNAPEVEGCRTNTESVMTVSKTKGMYLVGPHYWFRYNLMSYTDRWGNRQMYLFEKPYAMFVFGFYFYKGFPISSQMQLNALRLRENGLADKSLNDQYFLQTLKQKFSQKEFEVGFAMPWSVYVIGCVISIVTFLIEYLHKNRLEISNQD